MKRMIFILLAVVAIAGTTASVKGTVYELGIVTNYIGLSTDTKPSTSVKTGSMFLETDTGGSFIYNGSAWVMNTRVAVKDTLTMLAPGHTAAIYCRGFNNVTWYYKVANINSRVSIAMQIKKGNGDWASVDQDSIIHVANGNYGLFYTGVGDADSTRFKWFAEGGGNDALITPNAGLSGAGGLGGASFPGMVR